MARPEKPQEKQPEPLPIAPPRLGKEAKIGAAVILLGLIALGIYVVLRFSGSAADKPAASADALFKDIKTKPSSIPSAPPPTTARAPELGIPPLAPPKTAVRSRYGDISEPPPAPKHAMKAPAITKPVEKKPAVADHKEPLPALDGPPLVQPEKKASRFERSTPPPPPVKKQPPPAPPPTTVARLNEPKRNDPFDVPPTRPSVRPGRIYVVKSGETLFDIARTQLGKATRWIDIYDLNQTILGKELENLQPGMKLTLPDEGR